ncbi:hypothetical protein BDV98DRAFT_571934 [Pterulicium gracile]|uniref:Uncharacterized protein n=1 Tax=Pterulicium gracile TaxID=1884261 RepID=A0A5C3QBH3_9AGAR|nr:hypothetical protein BDV98DRAFT_571934 [Pterula gracilis]
MLSSAGIALVTLTTTAVLAVAQGCTSNTNAHFNLQAVYTKAPPEGPTSVHLQILHVQTVPRQSWQVLTAGSSSSYTSEFMTNGVLSGTLPSNPMQRTTGIPLAVGETPTFQSLYPYPIGWAGYCLVTTGATSQLAVSGQTDQWALCSNSTAGGRLDVVYSPTSNHPHYNIATCNSVSIELIP